MTNSKWIAHSLIGTLLSILVFFSISFISFLTQISPLHYYKNGEAYGIKVGFPFTYYEEFLMKGNTYPNAGWAIDHLLIDCLLTWLVVVCIYVFTKTRSTKKTLRPKDQ